MLTGDFERYGGQHLGRKGSIKDLVHQGTTHLFPCPIVQTAGEDGEAGVMMLVVLHLFFSMFFFYT